MPVYIGTDRVVGVRLNFFSKNRMLKVLELELELEQTNNDCAMF